MRDLLGLSGLKGWTEQTEVRGIADGAIYIRRRLADTLHFTPVPSVSSWTAPTPSTSRRGGRDCRRLSNGVDCPRPPGCRGSWRGWNGAKHGPSRPSCVARPSCTHTKPCGSPPEIRNHVPLPGSKWTSPSSPFAYPSAFSFTVTSYSPPPPLKLSVFECVVYPLSHVISWRSMKSSWMRYL